ncbi:MAG: hypothetical protein R3A47_03555 [Polyangiales bacterium]
MTIVANRGSEVGVNKACGGGKAHRFLVSDPRRVHAPKKYAYGINVAGTSVETEVAGKQRYTDRMLR